MAVVRLDQLSKRYGALTVVDQVDLTVADGEFMVLLGPSGCGKSTTLRMIAGLETISSGNLSIDGRVMNDVPAKDRDIAMVFQSYALYPHMSVAENLAFGLRRRKIDRAEIDRRVSDAARILGLATLLERKPAALSGGQRQRVALGRAMVREPMVFLFDEPLSNLDASLRVNTRNELIKQHRRLGSTMIYVTHDQVEAMTMADKIVVLQAGVIEQVGTPLQLYHHPANLFVAGFIGSPRMNFLKGRVAGLDGTGVAVELAGGARIAVPVEAGTMRVDDPVTLGVRPEALRPDAAGPLAGTVRLVERLGGLTLIHAELDRDGPVIVQIEGSDGTAPHQRITLQVDPAVCQLFDTTGRAMPHLTRHPLAP